MGKSFVVAKINLKYTKLAYFISTVATVATLISTFISFLVNYEDSGSTSTGNNFFISMLIFAILIPTVNYRCLMNLNVKKMDYFIGSFYSYVALAFLLTTINFISYYTIDRIFTMRMEIYNIVDIFGWMNNGLIVAFIQLFVFLLLCGVMIHTLTSIQTHWIGWVIDIVLIAILAIFIPIAFLRHYLVQLLTFVFFNPNFVVQITTSLAVTGIVYLLYLFVLRYKKI